jgi:hypothetical protein
MPSWLETDWSRLFTLEMSLPEAVVRGTLVYLFLAWSYALDWLSYREQKRATLRSGRWRLHGAARDFVVAIHSPAGFPGSQATCMWSRRLNLLQPHARYATLQMDEGGPSAFSSRAGAVPKRVCPFRPRPRRFRRTEHTLFLRARGRNHEHHTDRREPA